jgi:hypothetical protein
VKQNQADVGTEMNQLKFTIDSAKNQLDNERVISEQAARERINCSKRADELVHRLKMQQEALTHS